jgi:hypothetical protein
MTLAEPQSAASIAFTPNVGREKAPISIAAWLSAAGGALLLVLHMTVRLLSVVSNSWSASLDLSFVFGLLGLLSIVPITVELIVGHLAMAATRPGSKKGRIAAVVGLVVGYVLLVLYFNRLLLVILALTTGAGDWSNFVQYFYYFA